MASLVARKGKEVAMLCSLRVIQHLSTSAANTPRVGFIGLGNMGGHMARNLGRAGCALFLHDVNRATAESIAGSIPQVFFNEGIGLIHL